MCEGFGAVVYKGCRDGPPAVASLMSLVRWPMSMSTRDDVLDLLRENARFTVEDIARQTGSDAAEVEEVIADLEASGALRGYRAVVDWDELDRERVRAV